MKTEMIERAERSGFTPSLICEILGISLDDYEKIPELRKENLQHRLRFAFNALGTGIYQIIKDQKEAIRSMPNIQECFV